MEALKAVKRVLGSLSSPDTELENAVQQLARLLYNNTAAGPLHELQQQAFELSLVKSLLGVLGSSSNPGLLAKCAGCLALLTHGNDEARVLLGAMGAISLLIELLEPRSIGGTQKRWHRDWIQVYTQTLVALRKLTFLNQDNQQQLAVMGGVKLILSLVNDEGLLHNFHQFLPEAKIEFESLALNKNLLCRVQPATEDQKGVILSHFSAFAFKESVMSPYYPAYNVTLLTSESSKVSDVLLERGVVWPDHTHCESDAKLTRVCVTCVEDGGHFWCLFLSDKHKQVTAIITEALSKLAPPTDLPPDILLTLGDVYAAYIKVQPDSPPQWVRARLLAKEAPNDEEAIPCRLREVRPPPANTAMLENAAAVLRNLAFEMLIFRKEIMNFGGIETLLRMGQYPHNPTAMQALGALLNMAVSSKLREEIGKRGAVHTLLEMCSNADNKMLEQVTCCLYNVVLGCHSNLVLLMDKGGGRVLADLLSRDELTPRVTHSLIKLVELIPSKRSAATGVGVANSSLPWGVRQDSVRELKSRVTKTGTHPVCHTLESDDSDCEGVRCEAVSSEAAVKTTLRGIQEAMLISQTKSYCIDKMLPGCQEEGATQSFVTAHSVDDLPTSLLRRTICAFINTGKECTMYIGVDKRGVVRGVKVQRKERDLLVIAIDNLTSSFTPRVQHTQYGIVFVPVLSRGQRDLEDMFVVELTVKSSTYQQVYTIRERNRQGEPVNRCYYRRGPFNEQLSFQELRDIVAKTEADQYSTEIRALEDNIQRLSAAVRARSQ